MTELSEEVDRDELLPLVNDQEAVEAIQRINAEAGTFLGFTLTFYAIQGATATSALLTGHRVGPLFYLVPLLVASDFLTVIFALAAIARFDLGFEIARIYRPWPTVKAILDQEPGSGDWFPRVWFKLEEALSRRVPIDQQTRLTRGIEWVAPLRQVIIIAAIALVIAGTNYLAVR